LGVPAMPTQSILVHAIWDPEASVFVATSDDVPGLVAEAATEEALQAKLDVLIPELLELNGETPRGGHERSRDIAVTVRSERTSVVRVHA
jgi:hypothetical protein